MYIGIIIIIISIITIIIIYTVYIYIIVYIYILTNEIYMVFFWLLLSSSLIFQKNLGVFMRSSSDQVLVPGRFKVFKVFTSHR